MAMLHFNPSGFIAQPLPHDRNALIPAIPVASIGSRIFFPPCRLSLASRRRRNSRVANIFKGAVRRGNVSGSREISRIRDEDVEVVDSDFDDDYDDEEEEEEEGRDEDEDEDEIGDDMFVLGLGSRMQKWFENKPSGFGEGKVYDTTIEDKLLDEMQQSRIAQAANINKLKNGRGNDGDNVVGKKLKKKKNEVQVEEEEEVVPTGVPVRLGNLPKKKNIHRDLNLAFKGFAGISAIVPAVAGNKKTRDPVCLGYAHVYLQTEDDALRFVRMFSGKALTFGRVQKQIKCGMMNSGAQISAQEIMDEKPEVVSQLALPVVDEYPFMSSPLEYDDVVEAEIQLMGEDMEYFTLSGTVDAEAFEASSTTHPSSSALNRKKKAAVVTKPPAKTQPNNNAPSAKAKSGKTPKLQVPGSAKRLKIREKAVLTGVLSKYQSMAAAAAATK